MFTSAVIVIIAVLISVGSAVPGDLSAVSVADDNRDGRLSVGKRAANMGAAILERIHRKQEIFVERRRSRKEVCYDVVGCFARAKNSNPLKRTPQSPDDLDTKFYLFTRNNPLDPDILVYGDKRQSIVNSSFEASKPTKIVVHGFKGNAKHKAALKYVTSFLAIEDCNVVMVDWHKGAAGPSYPQSASNTQLIGRQLALLLVDIISLGAEENKIHIIGFSLGAHLAGFAGRAVQHRGIHIGRITALDPASPLFRQSLSTSLPPLNSEDAKFVDVIHTDAAKLWANGFGLYNPLGHVDYFPNGGLNQPGCAFVRASLIVSHFEGHVNSSVVCNHVRAHQLFLESITNEGCQFSAFRCHEGPDAFKRAECFPNHCDLNSTEGHVNSSLVCNHVRAHQLLLESITNEGCQISAFRCHEGPDAFKRAECFPNHCDLNSTGAGCGLMGYKADQVPARGPLFLVTRDSPPFCGEQMHATIVVSQRVPNMRGYFQLVVKHGNESTAFQLYCEFQDAVKGGLALRSTAAAKYNTISPCLTPKLEAHLSYRSLEFQNPEVVEPANPAKIYVDSIMLADLHGNRWYYCGQDTVLESKDSSSFLSAVVKMDLKRCFV